MMIYNKKNLLYISLSGIDEETLKVILSVTDLILKYSDIGELKFIQYSFIGKLKVG